MKSSRHFETWAFRVSHGELLVRSPKAGPGQKNLDLVFVGVEYLSLPRLLDGLEVVAATDEDRAEVAQALGSHQPGGQVFVLRSQGVRHRVFASHLQVLETDLDLFETPFGGWSIAQGASGP